MTIFQTINDHFSSSVLILRTPEKDNAASLFILLAKGFRSAYAAERSHFSLQETSFRDDIAP